MADLKGFWLLGRTVVIAFLFFLLLIPGYGLAKIQVLTSIAPLYCFCVNVGGEYVEVKNLFIGGADPHESSLSAKQLKDIHSSDLIVINGLGMEHWVDLALSAEEKSKKLVVSTLGISPITAAGYHVEKGLAQPEYAFNPHVWLDPNLASIQVMNISKALSLRDPLHKEIFERNATLYISKLKEIDQLYQQKLDSNRSKKAFFYNDAFMYLANRYGIVVAGIVEECGERGGPSPRKLATILGVMKIKKIPFFYTPFSNAFLVKEIIREGQSRSAEIDAMEGAELHPLMYEKVAKKNLAIFMDVFGGIILSFKRNF
ncbi:zinc ABC transporter substrate-binding protein [Methylacidiphilum caldifontis]|uniref:metal ABC transporter substrate-binding protein n=1 Tax=Methylacidiphilum caldifontis TaxID=2795386 RepID=UPI001A8ED508|nr:zinc ABC transporter substrate-binding protein [Methylacidiphilum caldifontis]QSR88533.1 zinc ABC transporter substrate-binding protein [Methylacidiphilum caldifontis]